MAEQLTVWTVGHSNHDFDHFAGLLASESIEVVVDVRSYPYSKYCPHFDREALKKTLELKDLRYLYLGEELGGRPTKDSQYDEDGHALYGEMAGEPEFQAAVGRVIEGARKFRVALVCSEGDHLDCHRRLLVGKVLADDGVELRHILPNAEVITETTVELGNRNGQESLFEEEVPWRSTQSVSHRQRLNTSLDD
jgi:uncharacterized protein (DUF488 family)